MKVCRQFHSLPWIGSLYCIAHPTEIAHSLLNLFILLCPPSAPSTSSTKPSPTYSPSPYPTSPSENLTSNSSSITTASSARNSKQSNEKAQQLLQSGIPHTLTTLIPDLSSGGGGGGGGGGIVARSEEEFTRVKIALRGVENKRKEENKRKNKSDSDYTVVDEIETNGESQSESQGEKIRVARWRGSEDGLEEVANKLKRRREAGGGEEKRPVSIRYQF